MRSFLALFGKKFPLPSIFFILLHTQANAQDFTVTFRIQNTKQEPVSFATVNIFKSADSMNVSKKIADSSGRVSFKLSKGVRYIVRITSINYHPFEKEISINGNQTFSFTLESFSKTMNDVTIKSQRPLMRQEDDKTIVEPENLVEASTNGYEVLEKTPGLFIDQDGNIYISSLTPATVQINGRDMKMSASDMATLLKSLPPNTIDKIEIVRTPSAKYDASSTGGIVNVVLKKGVNIGNTGSVTTGFQQGTYGNEFISFNINNNNKDKKSSSFNLSYNKRNSYERIVTNRFFAPDSVLSQNAFTKYPSDALFGQYILTYFPGKWEVEISGQATLNLSRQ